MNVIRLQIAFTARDFEASVHFYETVLGMTRITAWDREDGRGIVLSAGGKAAIEIYGVPKGQFYDGSSASGIDIVFEVENVDEWYERLRAMGLSIASPPQDKHWGGEPSLLKILMVFRLRYSRTSVRKGWNGSQERPPTDGYLVTI